MLLYFPSLPLFPLLKWGQLNQTLGSLAGHAAKTRRLQQTLTLAPMPEGCAAACDGIQCAYDDSQAIINQINGAGSDMTWPCHFQKMSEHVGAKLWSLSAVCAPCRPSSGSSLSGLATMQSQCATAGKPTSYNTTYSFTSPTCSARDSRGADGLLQLNLLADSLLSILNWMKFCLW